MRIVMLLIVIAITGMTLVQWLSYNPPTRVIAQQRPDRAAPLATPARPTDLKAFEKDLNRFMQDAARQRQENVP